MTSSNDLLDGPYTLGADWQFVVYLAIPKGTEPGPIICFVAHKDDAQTLLRNQVQLLEIALAYTSRQVANWQTAQCFVVTLQQGAGQLSFETYEGGETAPAEIAHAVLRSKPVSYTRTVGGREFVLTEYPREENSEFQTFRVQPAGSTVGFPVHVRDRADLDAILALEAEGALNAQHAGMYLQEAVGFLQANDVQAAFRSYYYALLFGTDLNAEVLFETGLHLGGQLLNTGQYDYADWVADTVALRAESECRSDAAARALQLAGIAAAALGQFDETNRYFRRAVAHVGDATDHFVRVRVHMSFGLAIVDLMAHWETESLYTSGAYDRFALEKMNVAVEQLQVARELIGNPSDEHAQRMLCAINLDLIRAQDLKGDHDGALASLDELTSSTEFVRTDKLVATAVLYRTAILKKLADQNPETRSVFLAYLKAGWQELASLSKKPGDRFCHFIVLRADARMLEGQVRDALQDLMLAASVLSLRQSGTIRLPGPGVKYGGLPAIDVAGKLQVGYLAVAAAGGDGAFVWKAIQAADEAKGRYFRRDLALAASAPAKTFSAYQASRHRVLRSNFLRGGADPRILKADYEWFLDHDLESDQASAIREQTSYERGIEAGEAAELLTQGTGKTAFLSFYACSNATYVYLLTLTDRPPDVVALNVELKDLEAAVFNLNLGMSGNSVYGKIDPKKPAIKDKYFRPLMVLRESFSELASRLAGFDRIIISPHGRWHNLPLHALLCSAFWERGANPGIGYAPSIHGFYLLQRRASAAVALRPMGLTVVPAKENTASIFDQAHQELQTIFRQTGHPVLETTGAVATPVRVLEQLNNVGVQHILAHGRYEPNHRIMNSGLVLAGDSGLPSKTHIVAGGMDPGSHLLSGTMLMASGIRASHVTLQACSLGRTHSARGDELWGVTRALLAAGVGSVLAPMWEIDPESSTALLKRFYENWLINGQTKWEALAEAQRHLACGGGQPVWNHFYHWAPFQLVGC